MSGLYRAVVKVSNDMMSEFNNIEQRLEACGMRAIKASFEPDCINCEGFLPLDKLQEVKYIKGVKGVTLDTIDNTSD